MGGTVSKLSTDCACYVIEYVRRKRKHEDDDENPKKRKMVCTAKYIYKALFLDGQDYDIIVEVLGKEWKLHKIYLQQSPYFASMFSGSWNETNKSFVKIEVGDPNITLESLTVLFGSLYPNDEVTLQPCSIVGVLAAATLFQCDGLIDQCADVMIQTISPLTAVTYYNAACQYSLKDLKKATLKWFNYNLIHYFKDHSDRLRHISEELMTELVTSKDLCVVQMEFSLYLMLRHWVFLRLHPETTPNPESPDQQIYFKERPANEPEFLLTDEGKVFENVFRGLRLEHAVVHEEDLKVVLEDRIIPQMWLYPTLVSVWEQVLHNDNNVDIDPVEVPDDVFYAKCMRLGRVIETKEPQQSWRWNGFMMGLSLVWSLTPQYISVKRHRRFSDLVPVNQNIKNIVCRIHLFSKDKQGHVIVEQSMAIQCLQLPLEDEILIMSITKEFVYPVTMNVYLLVVKPKPNRSSMVCQRLKHNMFEAF